MALGLAAKVEFTTSELVLSEGDSVLFYTDGVTEAENGTQELFGDARLKKAITAAKGPPWGKQLLDAVNKWRGNAEVSDDLTLLEIWR